MTFRTIQLLLLMTLPPAGVLLSQQTSNSDEAFRPRLHFTPAAHWMNDPNGMVYYKGIYHLFYQHNPYSSVWGPMHWGHATSKDLIHWQRKPISLFPDSLGTIFSGSAVVDEQNTSGLGSKSRPPLIAIYTQHNDKLEKLGRNDFQNQSLAYSLDNGITWIRYQGNPILKNPGIRDFRDPKVSWFAATKKWIMTLAVSDHIDFYSSPDLIHWSKESGFGNNEGAHGGVWECPDLFPMEYDGRTWWVLIVNLNPGGPNQGSATQYFVGDFDGKKFSSLNKEIKWLDYGPDEYAGVTWSNTGRKKIFLGWMSNWMYANEVPTNTWRSAMTIPRELRLVRQGESFLLASKPIDAFFTLREKATPITDLQFAPAGTARKITAPCLLQLKLPAQDFSIRFSNAESEELQLGFDAASRQFFIDRTKAGISAFNKAFASRAVAPRFSNRDSIDLTVVLDVASVELFADGGLTTMTAICFPHKPYAQVQFHANRNFVSKRFIYSKLRSVWH